MAYSFLPVTVLFLLLNLSTIRKRFTKFIFYTRRLAQKFHFSFNIYTKQRSFFKDVVSYVITVSFYDVRIVVISKQWTSNYTGNLKA